MRKMLKDHVIITLATLALAVAFNGAFLPLAVVMGGSSGVSIIADYYFGLEPAFVIFVIYVLAIICGYILLGKKKIINSLYGSIMVPFWIFVTSPFNDYVKALELNQNDYLVIIIFSSVIAGIAHGSVYKTGYTTGGSDIASQIINKYLGMTVGTANLLLNAIIVIAGGFIFGWTKVLYAILALYIIGVATDKILLGVSYSKSFYIITDKVNDVKKYIINEFKQTVTEFDAVGGYTNNGSKMLLCVVPTRDYYRLKEGISIIDENAFFLITDAYELEGRM